MLSVPCEVFRKGPVCIRRCFLAYRFQSPNCVVHLRRLNRNRPIGFRRASVFALVAVWCVRGGHNLGLGIFFLRVPRPITPFRNLMGRVAVVIPGVCTD